MTLAETLHQALRHFVHLDESNAAIHCAPVRYSPLTFRLAEHLSSVKGEHDDMVIRVVAAAGQYEEDPGR